MTLKLRLLNLLLHFLHLSIIFFIVFAWLPPSLRPYHLAFILTTLASWMALGYCPLTKLHWRIRQTAGLPPAQGPYIPFLMAQLTRKEVDAKKVDRLVVRFTLSIAGASLALNFMEWFKIKGF